MNTIWSKDVTPENLVKLGFTEHKTDEPFDSCWRFENDNFKLDVDCFGEMQMARKCSDGAETEYIDLFCEDWVDVSRVLDWIAD